MNDQISASHGCFLSERTIQRHGGNGHHVDVVHVRHHADDALRRGVDHWNEFQQRVVPCQMMVQRTVGEDPARCALADNRDALATLAVRLVEIASFDDRQAKRGEKSGRDDPD